MALSEMELFKLFKEFMGARNARTSVEGPDPTHRGVIDTGYVRPATSEFPKMAYRESDKDPKGFITKVVNSKAEQDRLSKDWFTLPKDIHALLDGIERAKNGVVEVA